MKRTVCILLAIIFFLIPSGVRAEEINKESSDTFTLLWTTDPQWYSFAYPEILTHQNEWVVENYRRLGIEYVIHTGDFVDMPDKTEQWEVVTKEYAKWDDAGIPYGVLAGNHDVSGTDYSAFRHISENPATTKIRGTAGITRIIRVITIFFRQTASICCFCIWATAPPRRKI